MGWEQLPPEEPKWVTNFCQGCKDRQELIASLQASLAESEARVAGLLEGEKRLREALVKISEWGCNGQCVTSLSGQRRKRQVK